MNFNEENRTEYVKEELEDIEDEKDDKRASGLDKTFKRKIILLMGIILLIMLFLSIILYVASLISNRTHSYTYEEVENVLKKAAISYFKDHPESLPAQEGGIVEIDSSNLVIDGKMKDLSNYISKGEVCTGTVQVQKASNDYLYRPFLNCGDKYSTLEIYKKVLNDNQILSSGYGLYSNNGVYSFRGEIVNNYVKLSSSLWRIVKINSNNTILLILDDHVGYARSWDDRYNQSRDVDDGINQYSASRIKEYLDRVWNITDSGDEDYLLSKSDKALLTTFNLCVGKRNTSEEIKDNSVECGDVLQNQKMGLLTLSEFMNASVDPNCKNASTISCINYNYLTISRNWWLATAYKDSTYQVFKVEGISKVGVVKAASNGSVRPVVMLKDNVLYKSGSGTKEDPYVLR